MTIAELIQRRLDELGKERKHLRHELTKAGARVSRQAIHAWFSGDARPRAAHVLALWHVLAVPLEEREAWMHAISGRQETPA